MNASAVAGVRPLETLSAIVDIGFARSAHHRVALRLFHFREFTHPAIKGLEISADGIELALEPRYAIEISRDRCEIRIIDVLLKPSVEGRMPAPAGLELPVRL